MLKTFTITSREIKTDKNSFISSSAKIGDRYFKIKFTKDCLTKPNKRGLYRLTIDTTKCSIERGDKYINKQGFEAEGQPTIWVREVNYLTPYTEEELNAMNEKKFEAVFGEEDTADYEPLPF